MENPQGNTMENSGKQNPESGFKSPPDRLQKGRRGFEQKGAKETKVWVSMLN
jgi:hypothetical protein